MVDRGLAKVIAIPNKSGAEPRIIKQDSSCILVVLDILPKSSFQIALICH
jgi:hypothetical protein